MMTKSEVQKVENLLRACAANTQHCRKVVVRAAALVNGAKIRIEFSKANLSSMNAWGAEQPIGMNGRCDSRSRVVCASLHETGKSSDPEQTVSGPHDSHHSM